MFCACLAQCTYESPFKWIEPPEAWKQQQNKNISIQISDGNQSSHHQLKWPLVGHLGSDVEKKWRGVCVNHHSLSVPMLNEIGGCMSDKWWTTCSTPCVFNEVGHLLWHRETKWCAYVHHHLLSFCNTSKYKYNIQLSISTNKNGPLHVRHIVTDGRTHARTHGLENRDQIHKFPFRNPMGANNAHPSNKAILHVWMCVSIQR